MSAPAWPTAPPNLRGKKLKKWRKEHAAAEKVGKAEVKKKSKKRYRYKTTPYEHQVVGLKKMLATGWGGALLMEPRTGKTKIAIDYASVMKQAGHVNRVLVVCPKAVIDVWVEEIAAHCPFPNRVIVWDRRGRRRVPLPPLGHSDLVFVITNGDAFSTPGRAFVNRQGDRARSKSRGGRYDVRRALYAWNPHLIVLDEAHRIKNPSAKKTTMLWSLGARAPYRLILTGTPLTKKKRIHDIYSQWKFLNPKSPLLWDEDAQDWHTAATFKAEYGKFVAMDGYQKWIGNRNLSKLHQLMHDESYAVKRDECFDLPARLPDRIIHAPIEGETARIYDEMAEEMIALIEEGELTVAQIKIVQGLRLHQIASGLAKAEDKVVDGEMVKGSLHRVGREKLDMAEDLLEDLYDAGEKVVIAARFKGDHAGLRALHKKMKVEYFELTGATPDRERASNIRRFKEHPGPAAFIVQPAAGSMGIDLSSASTMLWFSLTNSWVDFTQCEDRIALSGRARQYIYLEAAPIDRIMYDTLQEDGDLGRAITERPERLRRSLDEVSGTG